DTMVAVSVGDINLVGLFVDECLRRSSEILSIVASFTLTGFADLHQELSGLREFQDHGIVGAQSTGISFVLCCRRRSATCRALTSAGLPAGCAGRRRCAIAADPYIPFVVDGDSMV